MNRRRSRCLCRLILLLAVAAPFAAAGDSPALPLPFETFGGTAWTVADFDGDGRPDVLTARPELGGSRLHHRISIQLSAGPGRVISFAIESAQPEIPGIDVVARDVDGDHDVDLVFTTAISNQPIGVWINDGEGTFARGNPSAAVPDSRALSHGGCITQGCLIPGLILIPRQPSPQAAPGRGQSEPLPHPDSHRLNAQNIAPAWPFLEGARPIRAPPVPFQPAH